MSTSGSMWGNLVGEQRPDQVTPAAGWYTDPDDGMQLRWWSGTAWTDRFVDSGGGVPAEPDDGVLAELTAVGSEQRWGTVWVWLLAFSPWLTTASGFFAVTAAGPSNTASWQSVLLVAGPLALIVVVAALDVRCLRRWHNEVAHWAWAVCGGPVYLVARTVVLRRQGRFGSAPLWVVLGNVVASFVPFLGRATLYFWVLTMVIYSAVSPS
jgi:hypothetical protein